MHLGGEIDVPVASAAEPRKGAGTVLMLLTGRDSHVCANDCDPVVGYSSGCAATARAAAAVQCACSSVSFVGPVVVVILDGCSCVSVKWQWQQLQ